MKFAICNEIYQGWKLEDTLAHAAKVGYAGLEIAPFTLANSVNDISATERQRIRDLAARSKIAIVGLHWLLVKPEGLYLNHTDAGIRERTAKYFVDLVDCCADFGGAIMVVGSPKQRNILPGVSPAQAWDWTAATFGDAVKRAEDRAVLGQLLETLPARHAQIVALRFCGDLTQDAIAERVGVSQMQVSRVLRHSLAQLRAAADVAA